MSAGLWVLIGIVGFLLLLGLLPLRFHIKYGTELTIRGGLGLILLPLYPRKETKIKTAKKPKTAQKKRKRKSSGNKQPPAPLTVDKLLEWVTFGKSSLGKFKRLVRIRYFNLNAVIGGENAAYLALTYGGTAAALSTIIPLLEGGFRVRKTNIVLEADFGGKGSLTLETELQMTPFALMLAGSKVFGRLVGMQRNQQTQQNTKTTSEEAQS